MFRRDHDTAITRRHELGGGPGCSPKQPGWSGLHHWRTLQRHQRALCPESGNRSGILAVAKSTKKASPAWSWCRSATSAHHRRL